MPRKETDIVLNYGYLVDKFKELGWHLHIDHFANVFSVYEFVDTPFYFSSVDELDAFYKAIAYERKNRAEG